MKKTIFLLMAALVLVAVFWLVKRRSSVSPQVSPEISAAISIEPSMTAPPVTGQLFEITITENGLSPNNLNIKAGDTVRFINNDTAWHWPASGPHPTHRLCHGFDSLKGLKQGETYSFTFNEAGVCPFHDHLNAVNSSLNGVIEINGGK